MLKSEFTIYGISIIIITMVLASHFPLHAYGHGLGLDQAPPMSVGTESVTVSVKMTPIFMTGSLSVGSIEINLKNVRTNTTLPHATFLITISKENKTLLSEQFHAHDGVLFMNIKPANTDSVKITGDRKPLGWVGSHDVPVTVEAPILLDGGLYHYRIEVLTYDSDDNMIKPSLVFNAYVSIGEESHYTATSNGVSYDFATRTYFDKVSDFQLDDAANTIWFTMPFDWNRPFISQVPLMHVEVIIPKSVLQMMTSTYKATLNGVELPRTAIMTDDSSPDMRIVHYMIPRDRLMRIADEAKVTSDVRSAVFTLEPLTIPAFPLDTLTNKEKFKVQMSWSPAVIEPGKNVKFIFNIRDPKTDETLTNSYYEFALVKDGKEIYRNSKIAAIGAEVEQFTFTDAQRGNIAVRLENINHSGEFTEYVISVIPEFPVSMLALFIAVAAVMVITKRGDAAKHRSGTI